MNDARILVGDCREQLANIETGTIDAVILTLFDTAGTATA